MALPLSQLLNIRRGLTAVIGAPMDPAAAFGRRPTSEQLRSFTERLRDRELELMQLAEGRNKQ